MTAMIAKFIFMCKLRTLASKRWRGSSAGLVVAEEVLYRLKILRRGLERFDLLLELRLLHLLGPENLIDVFHGNSSCGDSTDCYRRGTSRPVVRLLLW